MLRGRCLRVFGLKNVLNNTLRMCMRPLVHDVNLDSKYAVGLVYHVIGWITLSSQLMTAISDYILKICLFPITISINVHSESVHYAWRIYLIKCNKLLCIFPLHRYILGCFCKSQSSIYLFCYHSCDFSDFIFHKKLLSTRLIAAEELAIHL